MLLWERGGTRIPESLSGLMEPVSEADLSMEGSSSSHVQTLCCCWPVGPSAASSQLVMVPDTWQKCGAVCKPRLHVLHGRCFIQRADPALLPALHTPSLGPSQLPLYLCPPFQHDQREIQMSPGGTGSSKGTLPGREAAFPAFYLSFSLDLADLVLKASPSEYMHGPKLRARVE